MTAALLAALAAATLTAPAPEAVVAAVLADAQADARQDLRAVVVLRDGKVIGERYYNGETPGTLHDVRSLGKSITALMTGIAIDQGRIAGVATPVGVIWRQAAGSAFGKVPLSDMLTMRSGLAADDDDPASPGNEDRLDDSPDPAAVLLGLPLVTTPGKTYLYNSATAAIVGITVAKASGGTMADYAKARLFTPLGIRRWRWDADASGFTKGQGNLWVTARDLATIGEMVRQGGRHGGRQIVSSAWLKDALAPHVAISAVDPYADSYGYFWYGKVHSINGKPVPVSFASGSGGNKLYVIPSRRMVVAITSSAYGRGYGQRRSEAILKAVLAVTPE